MFIKSIRNFRTSIKQEKPDTRSNKFIDEHFIGTYNAEQIKGFFGMYHGIKDRPDKYLRSTALNVAADEQAIYEFMQNAVDCRSSHFFIFYNESYFLAINNGSAFNEKDVKAILNLGQSDKGNAEIGSYGVGFKLTHRLIGKDDGIEELINEYKGPIVFSWSRRRELEDFLQNNISIAYYNREKPEFFQNAAWLFKICLTNFPTHPDESVKDLNYEERKLFTNEELEEFINFANENLENHVENIDPKVLSHGSMFFLKLGEGKKKYIDTNYSQIERGIEYSLNTLSTLRKVFINDQFVQQKNLTILDYSISNNSDEFLKINPKNKERDIKMKFGYDFKYWDCDHFHNAPNFYDYFPMESERHNFRFILHCNAFEKMVNRRELQNSDINVKLFAEILSRLKIDLESFKTEEDNRKFLSFYASLLLSEHTNVEWIETNFFRHICNLIKTNIPTLNGYSISSENVKIKNTEIQLSPSDVGCPEIEWFYWNEKSNKGIVDQALAKDKLGLKKWDIIDLLSYAIEKGKIDEVNEWVKMSNEAHFIDPDNKDWTYINFLGEIDKSITDTNLKKIAQIKLFKFSDGLYHSLEEVFGNPELLLISEKTSAIKIELRNIGLTTSLMDVSKNPNLNRIISDRISEQKLFKIIAEKTKTNTLNRIQKKNLFQALEKFKSAENLIGNLELFSDTLKRVKPLNKLIKADLDIPRWLGQYKITKSEYFDELENYLIKDEDIYTDILYEEWDNIIETTLLTKLDIKEFYKAVIEYYLIKPSTYLLNEKNCIATDNGFLPSSDIFYNHFFLEIQQYEILRKSIKKLTGFETPIKEVLEFLEQKPFLISDDTLKDKVSDTTLTRTETTVIFRYADKAEIDLFTYGHFIENDIRDITFSTDKLVNQYYSNSDGINNFIKENLSTKFQLLPTTLSDYKTKVLRNAELQESIVNELGDAVKDHVETLIDLLNGVNLCRIYERVSEFNVLVKEKYLRTDFEYKLLANIPENQIDGFNSKLLISIDDREFNATEITNTDTFKIDGKKLTLSKILTENQLSENAKVVSNLIRLLNNAGIPKQKLEQIFCIEKEIDNEWLKDKLETLLAVTKNTLENSEQLAFILLYHQFVESIDLSKVNIHCIDGKDYGLNHTYYSQNISFIEKEAILSDQYFDMNRIFELSPHRQFCDVDNTTKILFQPYFDNEESKFVCEHIKSDLTDDEKISLLEFIFSFWSESNANKRLIQTIDWTEINGNRIDVIFGLIPKLSVWDENIALENEKCPEWLKLWGNNSEKQSFLLDIGFNMNTGPISMLRKSFITSTLFSKKDIANNELLTKFLLNNTLTWIVANKIFIEEELHYQLLLAIAEEVDVEFEEAFDFESLGSCFEWNVDYYTKWKEETDCKISVFLHDGEMPVLISYNDFVLRKESKGDYAFDDKTNFLFINSKQRIDNILFKVEEDSDVPFEKDHLNKLLYAKNNSNNLVATDEYERVKEENEKLKELLERLSAGQSENEEGYTKKGGLSKEDQISINREARQMVKEMLLEHQEYDCSDWDIDENVPIIQRKIRKNGELIDIVVVSAKSSPVHLSPFAFNVLASNPNNQLFVRDRQGVHNVTFNDIFSDNQNVNMIFDTNFVPNTVLAQLAHVFNYVSNTKFVIENPHFSANNILLGFGLENKNSGEIGIPSDDQDW